MKFTSLFNLALVGFATAAPTPTSQDDVHAVVEKRASVTDSCNIGYASGTTGGNGGSTTTVSTLAQFTQAAESSGKGVVYVKGTIKGSAKVKVASNKTIIGAKGSQIEGVGIYVKKQTNVILRNLKISKVLAANGDAINIQASKNVWVDHCDLSSDEQHDKDYYDGLLDVNHGSDMVTVSNTYLHDHFKVSLVGHSDSNAAEDTGKLHVTYANNHWANVNSRNPSVRFGTAHIYNNYYNNVGSTGVNTRMGAQVRVESSVFENSTKNSILSKDSKQVGYATVSDVNYGGGENSAPAGNFAAGKIPYSYSLYGKANVKSKVVGTAGQTLSL